MELIEAAVLFTAAMGAHSFSIVATRRLADLRGRSRRKWTARAAVLGPVALSMLLILPARR